MDRDMDGERANELDAAVAQLAAAQSGVFSRRQILELKLTQGQIEHRLRNGRWEVLRLRVYRIGGAPASRDQDAMSAALWGGNGALVSHSTAAGFWGFDGVRTRRLEIWVPTSRNLRSTDVQVHRGTRLDRADRTLLRSLPITTPTRTLIDIAGRLEDHRLELLMESLFHGGLVKPDRLRARLNALRRSGRTGAGRLDELLSSRGSGATLESPLEALVWRLIRESGVPLPERQYWIVLGGDRYRLDFAWPDRQVALEAEGYEHHGDRGVWRRDRARFAELGAVRWKVLPVTWHAATKQPERVVRWLRSALHEPAA